VAAKPTSRQGTIHGVNWSIHIYLGASPHSKSSARKKRLVEAHQHGHDQDHVPSWKTMPPNDDLQSKKQCSNPHTM